MNEETPMGLDFSSFNPMDAVEEIKRQGLNVVNGAVKFFTGARESFRPQSQTTPTALDKKTSFTPENIERAENKLSDTIATGVENVGDFLGVPRSISTPVAGAVGAIATPGLGDLKLTAGAGSIALTGMLTSDPNILRRIPNVKPGIGADPKYAEGVELLRGQGARDAARREKFMKQFAAGEIDRKTLTKRLGKVKKRGDAKYSTLATPDDPDIFEKEKFQNLDPTNPEFVADQHHATTKAMTTPWVKKALELGDDDDVVALFELHRALTGSGMGNVRSGIIDIPGGAHDTAKAKNRGMDPKLAIHSFFKESGAGVEIRTDKVEKIIGNPKNMDELLNNYITFAQEYLIPQKELSLKRLNQVLSEHRKTIPATKRAEFDDMVDKLNKGNQ